MRARMLSIAFAGVVGLAAPCVAATVNAIQGQVLINRGQGYQKLDGTATANPGDSIVVNPGGSAQIVYPDGCTIQVAPGSVASIADQSPCQPGAPQTGTSPINGTTIAIGAVVVGGGIAAAILLNQKDKSASP